MRLKPITYGITLFLGFTCCHALSAETVSFRTRLHAIGQPRYDSDDIAAEIRFGREVAARILGRFKLHADTGLQTYVSLVGRSLSRHGRPELRYHFAVLDTALVNAFSAPGGYVFVTRGAIARMADESELAAVLAHEIAHINRKHVVRELNIRGRRGGVTAGLNLLLSGASETLKIAFHQAVDKAMEIVIKRGYRIQDEHQADRDGVWLLALAGYEPRAMTRFMKKIPAGSGTTHPRTAERTTTLERLLKRQNLDGAAFGDFLRWRFRRHVNR